MSAAVDVANTDRDADELGERDPYGEERIEVDEDRLRTLSPGAWAGGLADRLDDAVGRFVWNR